MLLKYGIDVNSLDAAKQTALDLAVSRNNKDIVELLCKNGANIKNKDFWNNKSLSETKLEIVEILLRHGADIK